MKKVLAKLVLTLSMAELFITSFAADPNPLTHPQWMQKANGQKNVAKISLFRIINPLHKDIDFGYERVITNHFTISTSLAIKIPYIPELVKQNFDTQPTVITDDLGTPVATQSVTLSPLTGIGFTPEFKFYTSKENDAPMVFM